MTSVLGLFFVLFHHLDFRQVFQNYGLWAKVKNCMIGVVSENHHVSQLLGSFGRNRFCSSYELIHRAATYGTN